LITIRAYSAVPRFKQLYKETLDTQNGTFFIAETCTRWVGIRLEYIGLSTIVITATFVMLLRDSISPALAGLAMTYSFQMTGAFQQASKYWFFFLLISFLIVRSIADMDAQMTSVERLLHYGENLPQEAPAIIPTSRPPQGWPSKGAIEFRNVCQLVYL
jgi:hypothetical protein